MYYSYRNFLPKDTFNRVAFKYVLKLSHFDMFESSYIVYNLYFTFNWTLKRHVILIPTLCENLFYIFWKSNRQADLYFVFNRIK